MGRHHVLLAVLAVLMAGTSVLAIEPADPSGGAPPAWDVAGTTLVLHPRAPFERGLIRIAGPEGYWARKSLVEGASAIDLLAEGRRPANERAGSKPEGPEESTLAPHVTAPLVMLPDGQYRFEAILGGATGTVRIAGTFSAGGGALVAPASPTPSAPRPGADLSAEPKAPQPVPAALTESEQLTLTDDNNNGLTLIELQADNSENVRFENWQIQNNAGDFRIVEDGSGTQNAARLTLLQDTDEGRVGIGTTAPLELLHLIGANPKPPRLRIEDNYAGLVGHWDLEALGSSVGPRLRFKDTAGNVVVRIAEGASQLSLNIDSTGVEVNADFSVSSSRSAKQNLLEVDPAAVLDRLAELPILEWEYRHSTGARHLGPVAEAFHEAFGLGVSERTISPLDLGGVALAAIQALRSELHAQQAATADLLAQKDAQIERLSAERQLLGARLEALEAKVEVLVP